MHWILDQERAPVRMGKTWMLTRSKRHIRMLYHNTNVQWGTEQWDIMLFSNVDRVLNCHFQLPSQEQSCNLTIISVVTTTADTILHQDVELASRRKVTYCEVLMKSSDLKRLKSHSQQNAEAQISSKNSSASRVTDHDCSHPSIQGNNLISPITDKFAII